jgi:hypothetical protein
MAGLFPTVARIGSNSARHSAGRLASGARPDSSQHNNKRKNKMSTATIDLKNPPDVYEWTGPTGVHFKDVRDPSGFYFRDTTPQRVKTWIVQAWRDKYQVRLFLGDKETGRDWMEEHDVTGKIGRSTGWLKTALLIVKPSDHGGGAILADSIVRMLVKGAEVYRHKHYHCPGMVIVREGKHASCPIAVEVKGEVHARFSTMEKAQRWRAFMLGERLNK